jgi:hypothetical protein
LSIDVPYAKLIMEKLKPISKIVMHPKQKKKGKRLTSLE